MSLPITNLHRLARRHQTLLFSAFAMGFVVLALGADTSNPAALRVEEQVHPVIVPNFKYTGNASCGGSNCHGSDKAKVQSGQNIGDELTIWSDKDPHATAWKTLTSADSKKIAGKLNLASATDSARCLSCHATDAPAAQRGEQFAKSLKDEAVSCESCHGPGEKWLQPHAKAGWTAQQRGKLGAQGMLEQFALVDTSNLAVRANRCVSCHLQIDKDLLDAGHPALDFELYAYNYYVSKKTGKEFSTHWDDAKHKGLDATLWAVGQAAGLNAARTQLASWKSKGVATADAENLVKVYEAGVNVAKTHLGADTAKGLASAPLTPAKISAAAKDLAKLASDASLTTQPAHRRTIASGVTALGSAYYDIQSKEAPETFWQAYEAALKAVNQGGPAYVAAVNQMIAAVQ